MNDEYEYIPEDILRNIASYSQIPRLSRVSSSFAGIERSLEQDRIDYMNRRYPGWQSLGLNLLNAMKSMVLNHDLDAIKTFLHYQLIEDLDSRTKEIVDHAIDFDNVDVIQFIYLNNKKMFDKKLNHFRIHALSYRRPAATKFLLSLQPTMDGTVYLIITMTNFDISPLKRDNIIEKLKFALDMGLQYNRLKLFNFIDDHFGDSSTNELKSIFQS